MKDQEKQKLLEAAVGLPGVIHAFYVGADKKVCSKDVAGRAAVSDEVWIEIQRTVVVLTKASLGADTFRWVFGDKILIIRHAVSHTFGVVVEGTSSGDVFVLMQRLLKDALR
jgi:hypothetical protein